ncbi:cAMP-regulated phosphoprotein 21-like isoform X2 [Dreissena polymorpha]|uniref:cAMP-regulated phosphoprotein 21-like isoform X2 n=1 Tax=Dreissena polymorpha TaxID=45954 RepID=UPI0022655F55|nr:cAMP-regulated phosphoprotein 21-like isoform X2 [Dreissena polymorpha]
MPSEQPKDAGVVAGGVSRPLRSSLLQKQPEIEEVDEENSSPGSDQSDTTITAGTDTQVVEGDSPENGCTPDLNSIPILQDKNNHISPKLKQLTRSEALCDDCASPPLHETHPSLHETHPSLHETHPSLHETQNLKSTASTCSSDSSSSGIGTKSSFTSGSMSGSSFHGKLEKSGSQSSEAGTSSSLSRDSSVDTPYKDSTGIDLEDFIKKTLNKTPKDRSMLIKLEVDLIKFIREPKHHYLKFQQMSSYDRMLVHRIAAFFGLDHNVDQTGKCVIVNKTANTRIPDFSFQEHITKGDDSKPMMLLKRGVNSFDDSMSRGLQKPNMAQMNKAKSLEERQQNYVEVRNRIFLDDEGATEGSQPIGYSQEDAKITGIIKCERPQLLDSIKDGTSSWSGYDVDMAGKSNRILVPKANSFGGMQTFMFPMRSPMRGGSLSKADSMSMQMGLQPLRPMLLSSPSCSQSDVSSVSGSAASGYGHATPQLGSVPAPGQRVYWVASDLNSIPAGSVLINPQTGQPYMNPDGSMHKYMPGQPLPQQQGATTPSPQPQTFGVAQDWTIQDSQNGDLCQQMSMVNVTPQTSLDGAGSGDGVMVMSQQPAGYTHSHQQMAVPAQQTLYYQSSPCQQPVRYMCSMNYCPQGHQHQSGFGPGPGVVPVDSGSQGVTQGHAHQQQYCPQQYVQQGFHGNQSMYSLTSPNQCQNPTLSGSQSCDYQCAYNVTSPVEGSGNVNLNAGGFSYPVTYGGQQQQSFVSGVHHQPAPMFYTYQNNQQSNMAGMAPSYMYGAPQGAMYASSSPPTENNQSSATSAANVPQQQPQQLSGNPMNNIVTTHAALPLNSMNSVNVAPQQGGGIVGHGLGQGQGQTMTIASVNPGVTSPGGQYVSFPSVHNPSQQYHQGQSFSGGQLRAVAPQFVPMAAGHSGLQMGAMSPMVQQPFHQVYRLNMQNPMHFSQWQCGQSNPQSLVLSAQAVNRSPGHLGSGPGHVTVSAKGLQSEGKPDSGALEGGDGNNPGETGHGYGPVNHNTGDPHPQFHQGQRLANQQATLQSQLNTRSSPNSVKTWKSKSNTSIDSSTSDGSNSNVAMGRL